MKLNKSNFDIMAVVGGVAGGVVSKVVEKFTTSEDQENNYLTIGIQAIAGSAISAFVNNNAIKAAGAAMIGVAGYNLAKELNIGTSEETDTTPTTSGIGLLPAQMSIASTASAFSAKKYPLNGIKGTEKEPVKSNVI